MADAGDHLVELGGMDFRPDLTGLIKGISAANANFALPADFIPSLAPVSLGPDPPAADVALFSETAAKAYSGEAGRQKLRQACVALLSRDSLHLRLDGVVAPVLWIRGSKDAVFTEASAKEDIALFTNTNVVVETVEGGYHAPSWTHAKEVNALILSFIKRIGGKVDARALREAVGMVDI
jgi:pimeloyl-ACP methyl ester carboxylesterase